MPMNIKKKSDVWNNILNTTIINLVNSFTQRCFYVLKNEGNCIGHLITRDVSMPTDAQIEELITKCQEK